MKKSKLKLSKVFDYISLEESHTFVFDEIYTPKTHFEIDTPNGKKSVVGMMIKEDETIEITTTLGSVKTAKTHKIKYKDNWLNVADLKIGDIITQHNDDVKITSLTEGPREIVYDLSIDDSKHEWIDANGFIHHNTFGVKQVLTSTLGPYGEGLDSKWQFYEGLKTSPLGLYQILLLNKRKLIVFDDSDSIWGNADMVNMMKIALSDSGDRTISWASKTTANVALMTRDEREVYEMDFIEAMMEDPNTMMKPPSSFNFEGQMINISNMKANKFDDAIKSRSIFIDVYLAERDVLRRMASIKKMQGMDDKTIMMLLSALVPDAKDALDGKGRYGGEVQYVTPEIARQNKTLNMRSLDITQALYESGAPDWARMSSLYA